MHKQLKLLERLLLVTALGFTLGFITSTIVEYFDNDSINNEVLQKMDVVLPEIRSKKVSEVVEEIELEAAKEFIRQKREHVESRGLIVKKSIQQKIVNDIEYEDDVVSLASSNIGVETPKPISVPCDVSEPMHLTSSSKKPVILKDNPKVMEKPDVMDWHLGCSLDAAIAKYCYLWGYDKKGDISDSVVEVKKVVGYYTERQHKTCLWMAEMGLGDRISGYNPLDINSIQMNIDGYCKDE